MWIYLSNSFLSLVRDRNNRGKLLVRSRFVDDIKNIFPSAHVIHSPENDYAHRSSIDASTVSRAIAKRIESIGYDNFKDSVADPARSAVYHSVWSTMVWAQSVSERKRKDR